MELGQTVQTRTFQCTALTGGAAGALDAIPRSVLQEGDLALVSYANQVYFYKFDYDSTASESSPSVIISDSSTAAGRWLLQSVAKKPMAATAFTAQDATPSVAGGHKFKTANASATTITTFDDGYEGQEIFVLVNDANTTIDFSSTALKGHAGTDWTCAAGDHIYAIKEGSSWYCICTDGTT